MVFSTWFPAFGVFVPNMYIRAIIVFIVATAIIRFLLTVVEKVGRAVTSKTKTDLDDVIFQKIHGPFTIIASLVALLLGARELSVGGGAQEVVANITYSLVILLVAYVIIVIFQIFMGRGWAKFIFNTRNKPDETILNMIHNFIKIVAFVGAFLYILVVWGVVLGPFLAGLGIAGLAVALALQPMLANMFSGIFLALGRSIRVGDIIKADGIKGTVYKIGLRTTSIKTFSNEIVVIPNSRLADSTIQNFNQPNEKIRADISFGVEYGTDPEFVKKITIEELSQIDILDPKEDVNVLFLEMGESSLDFKTTFWIKNLADKWPAHQEAMTRIYRRLYKEGIGIPFPQRTVWLREEGKAKAPAPNARKFSATNKKLLREFGRESSEPEKSKEHNKMV